MRVKSLIFSSDLSYEGDLGESKFQRTQLIVRMATDCLVYVVRVKSWSVANPSISKK